MAELEDRIKYLEEKVEALIGMKNLHHEHLTGAKPLESFSIVSPDGKRSILLQATDDVATIKIVSDEDNSVSLYNSKVGGPVIGIRNNNKSAAMDVALSCKNGSTIQFHDEKANTVYFVDAKAVSQITTAEKL